MLYFWSMNCAMAPQGTAVAAELRIFVPSGRGCCRLPQSGLCLGSSVGLENVGLSGGPLANLCRTPSDHPPPFPGHPRPRSRTPPLSTYFLLFCPLLGSDGVPLQVLCYRLPGRTTAVVVAKLVPQSLLTLLSLQGLLRVQHPENEIQLRQNNPTVSVEKENYIQCRCRPLHSIRQQNVMQIKFNPFVRTSVLCLHSTGS